MSGNHYSIVAVIFIKSIKSSINLGSVSWGGGLGKVGTRREIGNETEPLGPNPFPTPYPKAAMHAYRLSYHNSFVTVTFSTYFLIKRKQLTN